MFKGQKSRSLEELLTTIEEKISVTHVGWRTKLMARTLTIYSKDSRKFFSKHRPYTRYIFTWCNWKYTREHAACGTSAVTKRSGYSNSDGVKFHRRQEGALRSYKVTLTVLSMPDLGEPGVR